LFAPHLFVDLAAAAPWGWYRAIALTLTEPSPPVFGTVMVLSELTVAGLVLAPGPATRLGLLVARTADQLQRVSGQGRGLHAAQYRATSSSSAAS
jgi:hypothetical protein